MDNSSDLPSLFQLNPDTDMILYGTVYFLLAFGALPFYVLMFSVGRKGKSNWSFKLMNVISTLEAIEVTGHFVASPLLLFPNLLKELHIIVGIIGPMMNSCYLAVLPTMATLAVCRLLIFGDVIKGGDVPIVIKLVFYLSMAWCLFTFIFGSITQNFTLYPPYWDYNFDAPYASLMCSLELPISYVPLAVSFLSYVAITLLIYQKKKLTSSSGSRATEIAILLQYTFITSYILILVLFFHFHSAHLWLDMENPRNQAIMASMWICVAYVNPVSLLIVNKSFRNDCKRFFGIETSRSALVLVVHSKIGPLEASKAMT